MAHAWSTLYWYAIRNGSGPEQAEDFAQDASLAEFNGRRTRLHFLWVDFLRANVAGRTEAKSYDERRRFLETISMTPETAVATPTHETLSTKLLREMTTTERVLVILITKWGLTAREGSEVLGVSEARGSQILKALRKRLGEFLPPFS